MNMLHIPNDKSAYLFELDDVMFPKRDYMIQIYYLFAQFVEFSEAKGNAKDIVTFMKEDFESNGESAVLRNTIKHFALDKDYTENFERLMANAHLPAKLILLEEVRSKIEWLKSQKRHIAILTKGNPIEQLNKLRHIDWQGLDREIKVYFWDELTFRKLEPIEYIAAEFGVDIQSIFFVEDYPK